MNKGIRAILWVLGGLSVLWIVLAISMWPHMSRMMSGGGMMGGAGEMMGGHMGMDGSMMGGPSMMSMMLMMLVAWIVMLALAGTFIYLVVDALRSRGAGRSAVHQD